MERDLNLIKAGYRLRYAIDFSEIFAYAYPLSLVPARSLTSESPETAFARRNFAVLFLFHDFQKNLLLLPPYVVELRDHLALVHRWAAMLDEQIQLLGNIEARLFMANRPSSIEEILHRVGGASQLTGNDLRVLVNYAKENYKELWVSLTCGVKEGGPRIRALFQGGGVQTIDRFYTQLTIKPDEIKEPVDTWFQHINELRPYRDHANYLDAIACAYLVKINEIVNRNGEVLLFITRSRTMQDVLNIPRTSSLNIGGEHLGIVRDLNCLIEDLVRRQSSDEETSCAVKQANNRAKKFMSKLQKLRLRQELQSPSADEREAILGEEDLVDRLEELIVELQSSSSSYENLQLAIQTKENLRRHFEIAVDMGIKQTTAKAEESRKVLSLLLGNAIVLEGIRMEAHNMQDNMAEISSELGVLLDFDSIASKQIQQILDEATRGRHVEQATALTEIIPFRVCFPSANLEQVAQDAYRCALQGEIEEGFSILMRVLAQDTNPERYLAWCNMLMKLGNWALAADIAQRGIEESKEKVESPYEFLLIKTICLSNMRFKAIEQAQSIMEQALSTCEQAISAGTGRQDDPRVYTIMAVLIWRYLGQREIAEEQGKIFADKKYSIDNAIEYAERALEHVKERELHTFILNNIARFYAKRNGENDLENAISRIQELERLLGQKDFPLSVSITRALLMLRRAERRDKGWVALQAEGRKILESAVAHPEVTVWERSLARHELGRLDKVE